MTVGTLSKHFAFHITAQFHENLSCFFSFQMQKSSCLPQAPAVRVVSFRKELPQRLVHYHHGNRQRGGRLEMSTLPVGQRVLLLPGSIGRGRGHGSWLDWVRIRRAGVSHSLLDLKHLWLASLLSHCYLWGSGCAGWSGGTARRSRALWSIPPGCPRTEAALPAPGDSRRGSLPSELGGGRKGDKGQLKRCYNRKRLQTTNFMGTT